MIHPHHKEQGMTLVELMVTMVLGLILLATMLSVYLSTRYSTATSDALGFMQQDARYLMELMGHDIRLAGYAGCRPVTDVKPNTIAKDIGEFTNATSLIGHESGSGWDNMTGIVHTPNTDVLIISGGGTEQFPLLTALDAVGAPIQVDATEESFEAGDLVIMTDCESIDLFRVSLVTTLSKGVALGHGKSDNLGDNLSKLYPLQSRLLSFQTVTYFVGATPEGSTALFMDSKGDTVQLADNVESLQLIFAIDSNNDQSIDSYVEAEKVTNWEQVIGVRMGLLLRSHEEVTTTPVVYTFNDIPFNPATDSDKTDRRLRSETWAVFAIRNRTI